MAETAKKITVQSGKEAANLQTLFAKMKNVYYNSDPITANSLNATGVECELELPVLEDGVTLNTGEPDVTEIKLTTGAIWVSRANKGDSDISFQVASIDGAINDLFLTKKAAASVSGITVAGLDGNFAGDSYSLDVNKVTGSLIMTDDNKQTVLILTNVEMYGGLVAGDSDNPAYFNVTVTPKDNTDGAAIMILHKTA
ncbi:MAG: hypothetical protein MJZ30_06175 [Paludibacteraceae bacterium]|nr:hypothetical protein [Paludibacteraceae bacterium]